MGGSKSATSACHAIMASPTSLELVTAALVAPLTHPHFFPPFSTSTSSSPSIHPSTHFLCDPSTSQHLVPSPASTHSISPTHPFSPPHIQREDSPTPTSTLPLQRWLPSSIPTTSGRSGILPCSSMLVRQSPVWLDWAGGACCSCSAWMLEWACLVALAPSASVLEHSVCVTSSVASSSNGLRPRQRRTQLQLHQLPPTFQCLSRLTHSLHRSPDAPVPRHANHPVPHAVRWRATELLNRCVQIARQTHRPAVAPPCVRRRECPVRPAGVLLVSLVATPTRRWDASGSWLRSWPD